MAVNRLEKLAINNQVVRMRKDVKRARLWLINSLTHRVKKLKGTKTNQLEKNQLKAENLRNEICLLKQICIDEVSKFAICNKQELPNLSLNDAELDLSQKLMLQLANHRLVQHQVQVFRQTYTGPMDRLILLVRSLGLQYKKKKGKKDGAETFSGKIKAEMKMTSDPQKTSGRKKNNPDSEFKEISASRNGQNSLPAMNSFLPSNQRTEGKIECGNFSLLTKVTHNLTDQMKPLLNLPHSEDKSIKDFNRNANLREKSETFSTTLSKEKQPVLKVDLAQKIPWPKLPAPPVNKQLGTMVVKQLHLDNEADAISLGEPSINLEIKQKNMQPPRDSFFLGGVDLSSDDESIKDSISCKTKRVNNKTTLETKAFQEKKYPARSRQPIIRHSQTDSKLISSVPISEVLHPSWQAKRKEKEQQTNFGMCQGKKIRFNDY